jgi:hypothetical protein
LSDSGYRKKMKKVLTERPRKSGGTRPAHSISNKVNVNDIDISDIDDLFDLEDKVTTPPLSPAEEFGYSAKKYNLSDHIKPLERFLHKQVGRPWDKVHSELVEQVPQDGTLNQHVWGHINDFVNVHTHLDGKRRCYKTAYDGYYRELGDGVLYVHESGILHEYKRRTK